MTSKTDEKKLITVIESQRIVTELYEDFPKKTAEARKRHVVVKDSCEVEQKIEANTRTVPGILTNRGCAFAGSKGVVFGPVKDILHLVHGPIGCAYFTWGMRRNLMKAEEGQDNFGAYCLSTDVKETDIVFGSEKKLAKAIREAHSIFKPGCIAVFATCPIGLIGDDIESVCKRAEEDLKIKVIPVRCEGYRGVSQSAGHHIASNALMEHLVGTEEMEDPGPFAVNVFGEYNIGGDYWVVKDLLSRIGYHPISSFTGDASFHEIARAHKAKLNILLCHRSINYTNRMM
ncbi:MAG TPA: nitrogenase component 1, partial [Methanothrix sp.]|nr:nitrogenase component 1 [Methanothrix sp.]